MRVADARFISSRVHAVLELTPEVGRFSVSRLVHAVDEARNDTHFPTILRGFSLPEGDHTVLRRSRECKARVEEARIVVRRRIGRVPALFSVFPGERPLRSREARARVARDERSASIDRPRPSRP